MRQNMLARVAMLALLFGAVVTLTPSRSDAAPAASRSESKRSASTQAATMRQFTGVVTALEKTSITVEKRGKRPRTMVFDRSDDTKTTGDLAKEARVTVYYRDEGGKTVAHRVVVKPAGSTAASASRKH